MGVCLRISPWGKAIMTTICQKWGEFMSDSEMTVRTGAIYLSPKFLVSSSQVTVRVDSVWHVPGSANIQIEISLMRHLREYFPDFSNITHRFSFLWMLLRLSYEISLKFQLAYFSHHASSWPSKDRCIWSRFIPPGLPQLDDQKNSCTLPPLSFYASATVFNWDLSALRSSKARRYSYERPRSGSNWDLSPDLCSQTFQLPFPPRPIPNSMMAKSPFKVIMAN